MAVTKLNAEYPLIYRDIDVDGTVPANGTAQINFTPPAISGYAFIGVLMARPSTGAANLSCVSQNISTSVIYTNWRNYTSSAVTATFRLRVLYSKE